MDNTIRMREYANIEGPKTTKKKILHSKIEMLTSKEIRIFILMLTFINIATHQPNLGDKQYPSSWLSIIDSFSSILLRITSIARMFKEHEEIVIPLGNDGGLLC